MSHMLVTSSVNVRSDLDAIRSFMESSEKDDGGILELSTGSVQIIKVEGDLIGIASQLINEFQKVKKIFEAIKQSLSRDSIKELENFVGGVEQKLKEKMLKDSQVWDLLQVKQAKPDADI